MKKFSVVLLLVLACFVLRSAIARADVWTDPDTGYQIRLEDNAGLLDEADREEVLEAMRPISAYGHVGFLTTRQADSNTDRVARTTFHMWFGQGKENGVLFLIDMYTREIYLFSDGTLYQILGKEWAYIITDNVYRMASKEDYSGCAAEAFRQVQTRIEGGKVPTPLRYGTSALLALIGGIVINYLFLDRIRKKRKTPAPDAAMLGSQVLFSFQNIQKELDHTTKEYSPYESSDGGSSGGGGGGGGGGSSGGGGGHGF